MADNIGDSWRAHPVQAAIERRHPMVLVELEHAFAVLGGTQFLPGYMVVLSNRPDVDRLSNLPREDRIGYLADVDLVATALENVCQRRDPEYRRVNIEILGNKDAYLHTHIFPRYDWEGDERKFLPVWAYPQSSWTDEANQVGPEHDELRAELTAEIERLKASLDSA